MIITERQEKALEALATYRYLTNDQMVRLGVADTIPVVRDKVLYPLKGKRPLIKSVDFGFIAGKGRLPHIHHLTKRGAQTLAEIQGVLYETITYPKGGVQFSRDYFHRKEFIDLHISIRQYAEETNQKLIFWHSYFDSTGNQRQSNNQLIRDTQVFLNGEPFIPDGNFMLEMSDGQRRLFSLELHKGNNTKRIIQQLEKHAEAIEQELLPEKYDHPFSNYVLSVYENERVMEKVEEYFDKPYYLSGFNNHFFLKKLANFGLKNIFI